MDPDGEIEAATVTGDVWGESCSRLPVGDEDLVGPNWLLANHLGPRSPTDMTSGQQPPRHHPLPHAAATTPR